MTNYNDAPKIHERPPLEGEEGYGLYKYFLELDEEQDNIQADKTSVMDVLRMSGSVKAIYAFNRLMGKIQ